MKGNKVANYRYFIVTTLSFHEGDKPDEKRLTSTVLPQIVQVGNPFFTRLPNVLKNVSTAKAITNISLTSNFPEETENPEDKRANSGIQDCRVTER